VYCYASRPPKTPAVSDKSTVSEEPLKKDEPKSTMHLKGILPLPTVSVPDKMFVEMRKNSQDQLKEEIKKEEKLFWPCLACTYLNSPLLDECAMCGITKATVFVPKHTGPETSKPQNTQPTHQNATESEKKTVAAANAKLSIKMFLRLWQISAGWRLFAKLSRIQA